MPELKELCPDMLAVLRYLWDEARFGCGWLRPGMRGWKMPREIQDGTRRRLVELLPYLAARGLLDRVDVLEPGRVRTMQLYRISTEGAKAVREESPGRSRWLPKPAPEDDREGTFYIPVNCWSALRTLRLYAAEQFGPVRLGEHGWMTLAEIRKADVQVKGDDLKWLLTRELIERREIPDPERPSRQLILYRTTAQGQRTEPVENTPSPTGVEYVAVQVRGEEAPGNAR